MPPKAPAKYVRVVCVVFCSLCCVFCFLFFHSFSLFFMASVVIVGFRLFVAFVGKNTHLGGILCTYKKNPLH